MCYFYISYRCSHTEVLHSLGILEAAHFKFLWNNLRFISTAYPPVQLSHLSFRKAEKQYCLVLLKRREKNNLACAHELDTPSSTESCCLFELNAFLLKRSLFSFPEDCFPGRCIIFNPYCFDPRQ